MLRFLFSVAVWSLLTVAVSSQATTPPTTFDVPLLFGSDDGFCLEGAPLWLPSELIQRIGDTLIWGSGCHGGLDKGRIQSVPFVAPSTLSFYLSGDLGSTGLRLFLRNLTTGQEFDLTPHSVIGDRWEAESYVLPSAWVGQPIEMVGEDNSDVKWFAFTAPKLPNELLTAGYIRTDRPQEGFCQKGRIDVPWAGKAPPRDFQTWRSYCNRGDQDSGWIATESFRAGSFVSLYVAGYAGESGVRLAVENLETKRQIALQPPDFAKENWYLYHFPLPPGWKGQSIRVLAEDSSVNITGWLGFALVQPSLLRDASFAARLLLLMLGLLVLTVLPAGAACSFGVRNGITSVLDLTAIGLLAIGLAGYGAFCTYFFNHVAGLIFSYGVLATSLAYIVYASIWLRRTVDFSFLRRMCLPLLLLLAASTFVVSLGFIYGKPDPVRAFAAARFGPPTLDWDNVLPKVLADDVYAGHIRRPMYGDWLSSDRPPLQAGLALLVYPLIPRGRDLSYQLLGTIWQLTFLTALWAYLDAARVDRRAIALILFAALLSGFTIFNSFYVWPKLLPVSFLLLIAGYVFTGDHTRSWVAGAVVGTSAAFAMLCHGGSAFGLAGIGVTAILLRRIPGRRFALGAIVTAVLLYLPWSAYQKFYDPPGDRLLKWHLAGALEAHPELKFRDVLISRYRHLGWRNTLDYKQHNFAVLFDPGPQFDFGVTSRALLKGGSRRAAAVAQIRIATFLSWLWSIDVLSIAVIALPFCIALRRTPTTEYRHICVLWLCTAMTLVVWCLLMFGYATTIVHQGCYFTEIAAFAAAVLTFWILSPKLALFLTCIHALFTIGVYAVLVPPRPIGVGTWFGPVNPVLAASAIFAVVALVMVLWACESKTDIPNVDDLTNKNRQ